MPANLRALLLQEPVSYYWLGFILADGYLNFKTKRLSVRVASKDVFHLQRLGDMLERPQVLYLRNGLCADVSVQDPVNFDKFVKMYGIRANKTYNPPIIDFSMIDINTLIAILVGFVDGDGSIKSRRSGFFGTIKVHASWLSSFIDMNRMILEHYEVRTCHVPYIDSKGYLVWNLSMELLRALYKDSEEMKLPILMRKWHLVAKPSNKTTAKITPDIVRFIRNADVRVSDLARNLQLTYATVYAIKTKRLWRWVED